MVDGEQQTVETSTVLYHDNLYEQIYDLKRKTSYYLGWDREKQQTIPLDYIDDGMVKYIPINDELLQKGAVLLPSSATDYTSIGDLEMCIDVFIDTWLEISKEHRQKAVWYVMLSWVYDKLNTIPYLRALGDYGTGKTRYLDVIGGLCYKPMFVGGSVKAAPIFRTIDLWRGTAVFDEFNLFKSDQSEDIIQILNNGYQKGKSVLRCAPENYNKTNVFDPFGPKILATRKTFGDRALESRCITEVMREATRDDILSDFTREFYEMRGILQNKLLMYRFLNLNVIDPDESQRISFGAIQPRIKQSYRPFTVLFQHDKAKLQEFISYVQRFNNEMVEENAQSLDGMIINHYLELIAAAEPYITSRDIRNALVNDGWANDKLDARTVGSHLKSLGFKSELTRSGKNVFRNVTIDESTLQGLKKRYVLGEKQVETKQERFTC